MAPPKLINNKVTVKASLRATGTMKCLREQTNHAPFQPPSGLIGNSPDIPNKESVIMNGWKTCPPKDGSLQEAWLVFHSASSNDISQQLDRATSG